MLAKENNTYFKIFILLFGIMTSCNHAQLKTNEYVKNKFESNSQVYNILNDSVHSYTASQLKSFGVEYLYDWQIDSMLCINTQNDKMVAVILSSAGISKDDITDDATKILGKKINNKWYFFKGGGSLAIPRSYYGKTGSTPLSFHELSQIARKELLESALVKNNKGEYEVDDKWVDAHFTDLGWGKFNNVAQYDSVHWFYIMDKWKHKIDTNEYKPLRKTQVAKPAS